MSNYQHFNNKNNNPHQHNNQYDNQAQDRQDHNPQTSLFKRSENIPQRFLSRIKPEYWIESGKKASPQSFMSDGSLSRSQNNGSQENRDSPDSYKAKAPQNFQLNPQNIYRTGPPNGNNQTQGNFNHQEHPYYNHHVTGYQQNPNYLQRPPNNYNYHPSTNNVNISVNQDLYGKFEQQHHNGGYNQYHSQQWNNYSLSNNGEEGSQHMQYQQHNNPKNPYNPKNQHPLSVHSYDSHNSNSAQNGNKHPKSAYYGNYYNPQNYLRQPPPQGHLQPQNHYNHSPHYHNENCNYNTPENKINDPNYQRNSSDSKCNCGMKRDTLAAKLIYNCITEGKTSENNNEKNLVNNFVRHFKYFGKNLEESRQKQFEIVLELAGSSLKRAKLCPNLPKELTEEEIEELRGYKYEELSSEELLKMCEEGKDSSNELQNYLNFSDKETVKKIYEKMKDYVYDLCFNKFSNYIVQLFIEKIDELEPKFSDLFIKNFEEMVKNQYASRVLQKMIILENEKFLNFSIKKLKDDHTFFLKNLSSIIFTTKLITESQRPEKFEFFEEIVRKNPAIILKEPNLIRILVSVFTVCETKMLGRIFEEISPYLWNMINHKFGMYIIQKVVERDIEPHKEMILNTCLEGIEQMIDKRYSKYALFKIIEFDHQRKFSRKFLAVILKNEELLFGKILKMADSTYIFLLAILNSSCRELKYLFSKVTVILMKDCSNFENRVQCKKIKNFTFLYIIN